MNAHLQRENGQGTPRTLTGGVSQPQNGEGRYPDFLIIGAARSGTTTLATHLSQHPAVFLSDPKEPFYFSHEPIYARGARWYQGLFARCGANQICGEASTSYSVWPECGEVAGRIAQTLPRVKLIYILRHPVDRAYSHYDYDVTRLGVRRSFEEALATDRHLIYASRYMDQIRQYLKYFHRDSLLCLLLDDLKAHRRETLASIVNFLGVGPAPGDIGLIANSADEHFVRMHSTQKLRRIPGLSSLADRLPRAWRDAAFGCFKRSPAYKWIARRHSVPPMRPETRQRLLDQFKRSNEELGEFLERDLSHWRL